MLRHLYRCVVSLHPAAFRKRFADEMLSIFDETAGKRTSLRLLVDGLVSLTRQWILRPEFRHESSPLHSVQSTTDGIPSFYTLDPFRPRAGAVIHGLVLSTAVFCLTCFAIKYSWIHLLHVHIPEIQFESPRSIPGRTSEALGASFEKPVVPHPDYKVPIASPSAPSLSRDVSLQPRSTPTEIRKRQARSTMVSNAQEAAKQAVPPSRTTVVAEIDLQSYVGTYVSHSPAALTILISTDG